MRRVVHAYWRFRVLFFAIKVFISAAVVSFASWLSGRYPATAGFVVALPITTMLVLPLSYLEHQDPHVAFVLARGIFIAIPISLTFFIPFLLSKRFDVSFWTIYAAACCMLPIGFFVHRWITRSLFS